MNPASPLRAVTPLTRSLLAGALLALLVVGAASAAEAGRPSAIELERGSVVRQQLVALGRDLVIDGEAQRGAAVLNGEARISGRIAGDLVVLGGDARLAETAVIEGDVFVFGGEVESAGATIGGRTVAYPGAPSTWLVLMEGPALGLSALSPVVIGAKLALLAAWMATAVVLLLAVRQPILSTAESVGTEPLRNFAVGLTAALAGVLTVVFFSAFAAAVVGVPMLLLLAVFAIVLKLWGTVAVFHSFGHWLLARSSRAKPLPIAAVLAGLAVLGMVKMVPYLGTWAWSAVTLVGIGATLTTKFGRREAWFEVA